MTGKNRVVLPALLALGLISTNANASDPCASVLCLYGKAVGQGGGSECRSAEKDFFKIVLGSVEKGKEVPLKWCFRTIPERISIEEINEVKIYPELF